MSRPAVENRGQSQCQAAMETMLAQPVEGSSPTLSSRVRRWRAWRFSCSGRCPPCFKTAADKSAARHSRACRCCGTHLKPLDETHFQDWVQWCQILREICRRVVTRSWSTVAWRRSSRRKMASNTAREIWSGDFRCCRSAFMMRRRDQTTRLAPSDVVASEELLPPHVHGHFIARPDTRRRCESIRMNPGSRYGGKSVPPVQANALRDWESWWEVYSPSHSGTDFTEPLFGQYMKGAMSHGAGADQNSRSKSFATRPFRWMSLVPKSSSSATSASAYSISSVSDVMPDFFFAAATRSRQTRPPIRRHSPPSRPSFCAVYKTTRRLTLGCTGMLVLSRVDFKMIVLLLGK